MLPEWIETSDFEIGITPTAVDRFNTIIRERNLNRFFTLIRIYQRDDTQACVGLDHITDGIKHLYDRFRLVDEDLHMVVDERVMDFFLGKELDYDVVEDCFILW